MMTNTYYTTKMLNRRSVVFVGVLLLAAIGTASTSAFSAGDGQSVQNKIKFNHKKHVDEVGAQCIDCHTNALTSTAASDNLFAQMSACRPCHEDELRSSCTFCHTSTDSTTYAISNPVRELTFSHQLHADGKKIECQKCHTNLDNEKVSVTEQLPAMKTCASCHDGVKVKDDCAVCHTNLASLRPAGHNRTDFIREHKFAARVNNASCGACHSQETCTDCHNGSGLVEVTVPGKDMISAHSPRISSNDRGQSMVIEKVHDLNYRFTHGVDARAKTIECKTCHSTEQFCTPCHQAGGNVNQEVFKPASHSIAGFKTIGVGSGGGEHARLAKRDIESCAACHSSDGADPVCVRCHMDPTGIKGTNNKTHAIGFMANQHGRWHSDPGANCYVCHTDPNARPMGIKGQRFCGYCHN